MDGILLESFPINIGTSFAVCGGGGGELAVHCNAVLVFCYPCDSHEIRPLLVRPHHLTLCLSLHWIKPLGFLSSLAFVRGILPTGRLCVRFPMVASRRPLQPFPAGNYYEIPHLKNFFH